VVPQFIKGKNSTEKETNLNDLTTEQLRAALAEYQRANTPSGPRHPDAPGCAGLSDPAREAARTLYGEALMKKRQTRSHLLNVNFCALPSWPHCGNCDAR
jgi:hypothetical protein